jgi:hypothetical protein
VFLAGNAAFKLMSVDLLEFDEPTEHIASRPDNIVQVNGIIRFKKCILKFTPPLSFLGPTKYRPFAVTANQVLFFSLSTS